MEILSLYKPVGDWLERKIGGFIKPGVAYSLAVFFPKDGLFHKTLVLSLMGFYTGCYNLQILDSCFCQHFLSPTDLGHWKNTRVNPVFKGKGNNDDCTNYGPISIISHVPK